MFTDLEVGLIVLVAVLVGIAIGQIIQIHFSFTNPFKKQEE